MERNYENKMLNSDDYIIKKNTEKLFGVYFKLPESIYLEFQKIIKENKINVNQTFGKFAMDLIENLKAKSPEN